MKSFCIINHNLVIIFFLLPYVCFPQSDNNIVCCDIFSTNPANVRLITEDLVNYVNAFEKSDSLKSEEIFIQEYFDKATPALVYSLMYYGTGLPLSIKYLSPFEKFIHLSLTKFAPNQIFDKALKYIFGMETYEKQNFHIADVETIKQFIPLIDSMKEEIYQEMYKLKDIYEKAVFPDIYFIISDAPAAGFYSDSAVIINLTRFSSNVKDTNLIPYTRIPYVIIHELIHIQDHCFLNKSEDYLCYIFKDNKILSHVIFEGKATFLASYVTGRDLWQEIEEEYYEKYYYDLEIDVWNCSRKLLLQNKNKKWLGLINRKFILRNSNHFLFL